MAFKVLETNAYKRDLKRCLRRGLDLNSLKLIVDRLQEGVMPPDRCNPHRLSGSWNCSWECHVKPDWLLIWDWYTMEGELVLVRTGTHSNLFE